MVAFATPDPLRTQHNTRVNALRYELDTTPETGTRQPMNGNEAVNRTMSEMHSLLARLQTDSSLRRETVAQRMQEARFLEAASKEAHDAGEHSRLFVLADMIADFNRNVTAMLPENDPVTL